MSKLLTITREQYYRLCRWLEENMARLEAEKFTLRQAQKSFRNTPGGFEVAESSMRGAAASVGCTLWKRKPKPQPAEPAPTPVQEPVEAKEPGIGPDTRRRLKALEQDIKNWDGVHRSNSGCLQRLHVRLQTVESKLENVERLLYVLTCELGSGAAAEASMPHVKEWFEDDRPAPPWAMPQLPPAFGVPNGHPHRVIEETES